MGRYNGDAWNIPRKIMLHHEIPAIKRQIALTAGFEGSVFKSENSFLGRGKGIKYCITE